jgi:hypothetical protein
MVSRLMVALALVVAAVAGGSAVTQVSAGNIPIPTGTPTPTRHGHGLV